jgi:hypothetical protein
MNPQSNKRSVAEISREEDDDGDVYTDDSSEEFGEDEGGSEHNGVRVRVRVSIDTSLTFQVLGSNHTTSNLYYFGLDKHTCVGFVLFYLLIYLLLTYY